METTPKTHSPLIAYLLILITFFVLLFFTKNYFSDLQQALDLRDTLEQTITSKQAELTELNRVQQLLTQTGSEEMKAITPFLAPFSEASILEYIYSYAQKVNLGNDRMIIRELSLSENGVNDIWFDTATINLSAIFSSEDALFNFLNFVTQDAGEYRFYLTEFEYPMNDISGNIQVSLPLTLYYKK